MSERNSPEIIRVETKETEPIRAGARVAWICTIRSMQERCQGTGCNVPAPPATTHDCVAIAVASDHGNRWRPARRAECSLQTSRCCGHPTARFGGLRMLLHVVFKRG